jgi:serine O-acetyltransferase
MSQVSEIIEPVELHQGNGVGNARPPGSTTSWYGMYRQDVARYRKHRVRTPSFIVWCTEQGLWALLQYRMASGLFRSNLPPAVKLPLLALAAVSQKLVEIVTGITLPYQARIGPGLFIGHYGNLILSPDVVIGHTCNLSQGVTIGVSGRGARRGVPIIGNRVYIAANAVVVGKIMVGDDAVIAANSLVTSDVAPHTTVIGVPAQIKNTRGSEAYLDPEEEGDA